MAGKGVFLREPSAMPRADPEIEFCRERAAQVELSWGHLDAIGLPGCAGLRAKRKFVLTATRFAVIRWSFLGEMP